MNKHIGKIIGVVIALLVGKFRSLPLLVIGLVIGQLFDSGFFSRKAASNQLPADGETDPYAVLGVSGQATQDEIEQAYRRRMSEYHPDKVASAAPELKALAEQRASEINTAYEQIQKRRKNA